MKSATNESKPAGRKAEPGPTPTSMPYWEAAQRGVLHYQSCEKCSRSFLYPRISCPICGSDQVAWRQASGRATLHSYVISHIAAPGFEQEVPYVIAMVQLEEGPRLMTNIVGVPPDPERLQLDMPLQLTFEERGKWKIPQFQPASGGVA